MALLIIIFYLYQIGLSHSAKNNVLNEKVKNDQESRLHEYLFRGYQKDVHPLKSNNKSDPVSVVFDTQVIRILQVNERQQYIKVYLWVNQYWLNPILAWDPRQFGGIISIHVAPDLVWVPDIVLYNSVDGNGQFSGGLDVYKHKVQINYDGKHSWLNPVVFKKICQLDVSYFPFDDQECPLKFGSWAHDASKLVTKSSVKSSTGNSFYVPNGEWQLLNIRTQENSIKYQCCEMPFSDVTVTIRIRRQAMNHALTLILPCALLSSLIVLGFILPPESGERIGLSITVLLAVTVFQQLTSQIMPPYDFPYLAQYYLATILQTAISLVVTTLILNFYHRSNRRMPKWVKKVLLVGLAPILFCQRSKSKTYTDNESVDFVVNDSSENSPVPEVLIDGRKETSFQGDDGNSLEGSDNDIRENGTSARTNFSGNVSPQYRTRLRQKFVNLHICRRLKRGSTTSAIRASMHPAVYPLLGREAGKTAKAYETKRRMRSMKERRAKDWLKAARVLDRFFFLLFVVISTTTLLVIFFRAPRFSNDTNGKT
eukprot:gene10746-19533_t